MTRRYIMYTLNGIKDDQMEGTCVTPWETNIQSSLLEMLKMKATFET
jgi:hypothetical protein